MPALAPVRPRPDPIDELLCHSRRDSLRRAYVYRDERRADRESARQSVEPLIAAWLDRHGPIDPATRAKADREMSAYLDVAVAMEFTPRWRPSDPRPLVLEADAVAVRRWAQGIVLPDGRGVRLNVTFDPEWMPPCLSVRVRTVRAFLTICGVGKVSPLGVAVYDGSVPAELRFDLLLM